MIPIRDTIPNRSPAVMVVALIIINSIVFMFELMMPPDQLEKFIYLFGIVPARYTHAWWAAAVGLPLDDYWPFLSSMFLHGGWLHIIGNMWTLWIFGDNVEDRMGPFRFLLFYVLCGLIAGIVHWYLNSESTVPTIGASGAIAGVLGAYLVLYPRSRIITLIPIFIIPWFVQLPAFVFLGIWLLTQIFSGTFALAQPNEAGGIAFWAHVGGFLAGMILHPLFMRRTDRELRPDEWAVETAWGPHHKRERWSW